MRKFVWLRSAVVITSHVWFVLFTAFPSFSASMMAAGQHGVRGANLSYYGRACPPGTQISQPLWLFCTAFSIQMWTTPTTRLWQLLLESIQRGIISQGERPWGKNLCRSQRPGDEIMPERNKETVSKDLNKSSRGREQPDSEVQSFTDSGEIHE